MSDRKSWHPSEKNRITTINKTPNFGVRCVYFGDTGLDNWFNHDDVCLMFTQRILADFPAVVIVIAIERTEPCARPMGATYVSEFIFDDISPK